MFYVLTITSVLIRVFRLQLEQHCCLLASQQLRSFTSRQREIKKCKLERKEWNPLQSCSAQEWMSASTWSQNFFPFPRSCCGDAFRLHGWTCTSGTWTQSVEWTPSTTQVSRTGRHALLPFVETLCWPLCCALYELARFCAHDEYLCTAVMPKTAVNELWLHIYWRKISWRHTENGCGTCCDLNECH